ncbi:hypothetical protein JW868_01490, partial [Candidatus Woesearchaeota archaeon]|nr:hypothetical protein [Candidatus Woesearchaeota archaeon]
FPAKTYEYDTNGILPGGGEEETVGPIVFNESVFLGGVLFDDTTSGPVRATLEELSHDKVVVKVAVLDTNSIMDLEDIDMMSGYETFSDSQRELLVPRFINN